MTCPDGASDVSRDDVRSGHLAALEPDSVASDDIESFFRGAIVRILFLTCALLMAAPAFSQERGATDTKAVQADKSGSLQHLLPPPGAAVAPMVNVYPGKHVGATSRCVRPQDWKDWTDWQEWKAWGRFCLCRTWEWADAERVIAIWIVILSIVVFLLFLANRKLVKSARAAASRQADDTRIMQRAYLSVQPDGVRRLFKPPETAQANISIVNAGRLPARNVAWVIHQAFSNDDEFKDFAVERGKAAGANVVVPQSHMIQSGQPFPAGLGTFATPESSSKYLYVWGAVFYDDGFGESRTAKFCHRYNGINYNGSSDVIAEHGRLHSFGNDAD